MTKDSTGTVMIDTWKFATDTEGNDVAAWKIDGGKILRRGKSVVIGVRDPMPIKGAPEGKQRLRMRVGRAARLFVSTTEGIREFILEDLKDHWFCNPNLEQGKNIR